MPDADDGASRETLQRGREAGEVAPKPMGWATGLAMLAAVILGVAGYIGLCTALGVASVWAGFAFALYWGGMLRGDMAAMPTALTGVLLGIAMAAGLHLLPLLLGTAGLALALGLILVAVYLMLMGRATFFVHNGTMLFLTIGTIPAVAAGGDFLGMGASVLIVVAIFITLASIGRAIAARKARPVAG